MRATALILILCSLAACNKNAAENAAGADSEPTENTAAAPAPKIVCDIVHERVTEEECADLRALREDVRTGAAALDVPNPMTRGKAFEVTLVVDRRPLPDITKAEEASDNAAVAEPNAVEMNATDMNATAADMNAVDTNVTNAAEATNNAATQEPPTNPSHASEAPGEPAAETPNQVVAQLPGEDHFFHSRVGRYMTAKLVGEGFETKLIEPSDPLQEIAAGGQGTWIWEVKPTEGGTHTLTAIIEAVGKIQGRAVPLGNGRTSKTISVQVRPMDRFWDFLVAAPAWLKALAALLVAFGILLGAWFGLRRQWRNRDSSGEDGAQPPKREDS
jgi:hypothetical protein